MRCGGRIFTEGSGLLIGEGLFFVWEDNLLTELLGDLEGFVGSEVEDSWRWKLESDHFFSVKSMYSKLEGREVLEVTRPVGERRVFAKFGRPGLLPR